jgi:EAL domain-containing protein (putative c-di-GMP-specific phosphodiesterase class I)
LVWHDLIAAIARLPPEVKQYRSRRQLLTGGLLSCGAFDCAQILKNADLALHRAKSDGHGNYRFFETAMDEKMQRRRNLEIDLRRALTLGEFALVYQPQLDLSSNRITGFEALLPWHCPTRGTVSPLEFIPVAEETGIIAPIGEWVLQTACREAAKWPGARTVAVNVSAIQFASPNLVPAILSALGESGLDPRRLELEITESVLLDARGTAHAMLQSLREIGVRVSLDDFGTGYSSLDYLRSFPFDKIKIDQSFVRIASNDAAGRRLSARSPRLVTVSGWRQSLKASKPSSNWRASSPTAAPMCRAI